MRRILITGATGTLGRALIPQLAHRYTVRLLSRKSRPGSGDSAIEWFKADLADGRYLEQATLDVDVIIHAASNPSGDTKKVDVHGTRKLLEAAAANGVEHFVYPSIVGIDRIPYKYYSYKQQAEELVQESGIPFTILRSTQFHALINFGLGHFNKLPGVLAVPFSFKFQSIDAKEVARILADHVIQGPAGRAPDAGGPEVLSLKTMARQWLEARGESKWLMPLPVPGKTGKCFRRGENTCPGAKAGSTTWRDWLELQYARFRRQNERS